MQKWDGKNRENTKRHANRKPYTRERKAPQFILFYFFEIYVLFSHFLIHASTLFLFFRCIIDFSIISSFKLCCLHKYFVVVSVGDNYFFYK